MWKKYLSVINTLQEQSPVCDRIMTEYINSENLMGCTLKTPYQVYDLVILVTYRCQADIHGMLHQVQNILIKGSDIKFTLGFRADFGTTVLRITDSPLMPVVTLFIYRFSSSCQNITNKLVTQCAHEEELILSCSSSLPNLCQILFPSEV